ncbi:MAG: hypothetical protein EBX50_14810 [Chitinophagia bacterium]|nr:hypothetical protein [Chitinophagia bacterium]
MPDVFTGRHAANGGKHPAIRDSAGEFIDNEINIIRCMERGDTETQRTRLAAGPSQPGGLVLFGLAGVALACIGNFERVRTFPSYKINGKGVFGAEYFAGGAICQRIDHLVEIVQAHLEGAAFGVPSRHADVVGQSDL